MQILILHTMIGLQTKFEANRTNNGQNIAFSAFWTASPPGPSYWANLAYLFFLSSFVRRVTYQKIRPIGLHLAEKTAIGFIARDPK